MSGILIKFLHFEKLHLFLNKEKEILFISHLFYTFFYFFFIRITAKIDDDMLSYYCNEDIFLLEVRQLEEDLFDITLTELPDHVGGK